MKMVHEITQGHYAALEGLLPVTMRVDLMKKRLERMEKLIEHKIKKKNRDYQERREKEKKGSKSKVINAVSLLGETKNRGLETRQLLPRKSD